MMINFYATMAELLMESSLVLATVVAVKGSTPREVGAKMLVTAKGQVGTIGGGAGEAKVYQQALEVLATGEKQLVEINLLGNIDGQESQGVCGGVMEVWLEKWEGQEAIVLIQQIFNYLKTGQSLIFVTPLSQDRSPHLLLNDLALPFLTGNDLIPPLKRGARGVTEFIEKIIPPPTLLIVGAGHCGLALAKVAHFMDMRIMVVDDRPDFAHPNQFPLDTVVITDTVDNILNTIEKIENLYIALVTRNYQQDIAAVRSLFDFSAHLSLQYLGIIGSIKRIKIVQQHLEELGYNFQDFPHIYAPIGLDIGALTPEEIAISICAEILKVKQGKTGKSLSIFQD